MHTETPGANTQHTHARHHCRSRHHDHSLDHTHEHRHHHRGHMHGQCNGHGHDHNHECTSEHPHEHRRRHHRGQCRHNEHDQAHEGHHHGRCRRKHVPALTSATMGGALRSIARKHGYIASRGPHAGDGNPAELVLALAKGDVATITLDNDTQSMIEWLEAQASTITDPALSSAVLLLVNQLREAAERKHIWTDNNSDDDSDNNNKL